MNKLFEQVAMINALRTSLIYTTGDEVKSELGEVLGLKHEDIIFDLGFIYDDCAFIDVCQFITGGANKRQRIMFPKSWLMYPSKDYKFESNAISRTELS